MHDSAEIEEMTLIDVVRVTVMWFQHLSFPDALQTHLHGMLDAFKNNIFIDLSKLVIDNS